ncbi:bifunctional adenosylcobinamide kinase/adenosylcobinamide-phosphate guanylyltransferase [Shewanella sp. TC10]|uniref:bifunctional adenosylcobinamide kinase/adenosylcobinamide-phosphate guanylyltransferase n=1 Tax=Shewanella sp. TC10 TaxID=1419739 RepID=UPI00129E1D0F|nr:bifunctional adenosylcobinamide kinase/adenosylcobinamide-phosphate guanylyltransferase [Shewanella sp. TC10]
MISLYLGGARSGKSGAAEAYAAAQSDKVCYIATATHHPSMAERIALHQSQRPAHWHLIEEPVEVAEHFFKAKDAHQVILLDCLTLWLTNLLMAEKNIDIEITRLVEGLLQSKSEVILVSTEVGQGVMPKGELSCRYVQWSGKLHQAIANVAQRVVFCQAGIPILIKGSKI